jgi:hypothetical protein
MNEIRGLRSNASMESLIVALKMEQSKAWTSHRESHQRWLKSEGDFRRNIEEKNIAANRAIELGHIIDHLTRLQGKGEKS